MVQFCQTSQICLLPDAAYRVVLFNTWFEVESNRMSHQTLFYARLMRRRHYYYQCDESNTTQEHSLHFLISSIFFEVFWAGPIWILDAANFRAMPTRFRHQAFVMTEPLGSGRGHSKQNAAQQV